ncbi:MAG: hypothetical protein ACP5FH_10910, partial [Terracidiphilus sp.]
MKPVAEEDKVKIPLHLRDFHAMWKSPLWTFPRSGFCPGPLHPPQGSGRQHHPRRTCILAVSMPLSRSAPPVAMLYHLVDRQETLPQRQPHFPDGQSIGFSRHSQ